MNNIIFAKIKRGFIMSELIRCPLCGKPVSSEATTCPHCGEKVQVALQKIQIEHQNEVLKPFIKPILLILLSIWILGFVFGSILILTDSLPGLAFLWLFFVIALVGDIVLISKSFKKAISKGKANNKNDK